MNRMGVAGASPPRITVDGKFFRAGDKKFHIKGVAYGPFAPNAAGQPFASPEQTAQDFALIQQLGGNVVRIYHPPAKWFLEIAAQYGLRLLVDIPWNQHLCFLESEAHRALACDAVRRAVFSAARHPSIFAFSVANEIPADIVRWSGTQRVADFIDNLVAEAKRVDPECLCTSTNFPTTEYLRPASLDFLCFNVYLHQRTAFKNYLARLQMASGPKPLLLGELGFDSVRDGEQRQAQLLSSELEETFREGLAGSVVFSFTDDWWRGGGQVEGWQMGITTRERVPKPAFTAVQDKFKAAPYFPLRRYPKISVVVACYNGERTLKTCLDSLQKLNYPDYEVLLVDDGSTDSTPRIAASFPGFRVLRHEKNLGLSEARDTGIRSATGEVVAFTDADCRADEDWLLYLAGTLLEGDWAGVGGPNLLPPEDSPVATVVMVSPGGPAHVMLTDRQAEHIPGCNMAFYKWALEEIGAFDPVFTKAGDDVDLCWRLQQAGYRIGFSPAAFVWHYRRSTVADYLRQQRGYGEAEALLVRKHPEYFNSFGGSMWRGHIYTASKFGLLLRPPMIYRGRFGSAGFQTLYSSEPAFTLMLCTTLEYHVLVTLPLWVLSVTFRHLIPLALTSLLLSCGVCVAASGQAEIPRQKKLWWSRPLVALLFFLQPIARGWARYRGRITRRPLRGAPMENLDSVALRKSGAPMREVAYWSERRISRLEWVADLVRRLDSAGWPNKTDVGWSDFDLEIYGNRWSTLQLTTLAEEYAGGKQMLRCRLGSRWSLQATVAFWVMCGFELLLFGFVGLWARWWVWLFLLSSIPLFAFFLWTKQRELRSAIAVFLDKAARELGIAKVSPEELCKNEETQDSSDTFGR